MLWCHHNDFFGFNLGCIPATGKSVQSQPFVNLIIFLFSPEQGLIKSYLSIIIYKYHVAKCSHA